MQNKPTDSSFPEAWCGQWTGELRMYNLTKTDTIEMGVTISKIKDSLFDWKIIYGADTLSGARNYKLVCLGNDAYLIDEGNGIRLTAHYFQGTLLSRFSVMNTLLDCKYQLQGDRMTFEIISGKEIFSNTTGDTIFNKDTIPIVRNFAVRNYQKAELFRLK